LLARVTALWRRSKRVTPEMVYRVSNLELDLYKKMVRRQGMEIFLSAKEFSLLEYLIVNKDRVLSRSQILESLWGAGTERNSNIVDVYINFLRAKIDKGFDPPLYIR
jgi:two-component system copper resistance phosphate regulon response regulator CusR